MTHIVLDVDWTAAGTVIGSLVGAITTLLTVRHTFASSARKDKLDTTAEIQKAKTETSKTLAQAESTLRSDLMKIMSGLQAQVAEQTDRWLTCEKRHGELQVITAALEAKNVHLIGEIARIHVDGERTAQRIERISTRVDTAVVPAALPLPPAPVVIVAAPPAATALPVVVTPTHMSTPAATAAPPTT